MSLGAMLDYFGIPLLYMWTPGGPGEVYREVSSFQGLRKAYLGHSIVINTEFEVCPSLFPGSTCTVCIHSPAFVHCAIKAREWRVLSEGFHCTVYFCLQHAALGYVLGFSPFISLSYSL